ncbi:hypothetical protein BDV12DRAFT_210927 [Aspergillus spectabilis]
MPNFGIATLSLGNAKHHPLAPRLHAAAAAGYKYIDLFDECWAAYLVEYGLPSDGEKCWDATEENIAIVRKLGGLVMRLGMRIPYSQPLRNIEGLLDPVEKKNAIGRVTRRFPFLRAFGTDLVFMCANVRTDQMVTDELNVVAKDLAELGDLAREFSENYGGRLIKIGYEGLSWARRNTWESTWEVVRRADRGNVGLVVDAFNILAVEFADPYAVDWSGRVYGDLDMGLREVRRSMGRLVQAVPGEKIFFFQVADAVRIEPGILVMERKGMGDVPALLPWSRGYRLFPCEEGLGAYLPVDLVAAAVLATGYKGPLSLEVFNHSLNGPGEEVPRIHAERGVVGLKRLVQRIAEVEPFGRRGKL